jgi:hypothetical protein
VPRQEPLDLGAHVAGDPDHPPLPLEGRDGGERVFVEVPRLKRDRLVWFGRAKQLEDVAVAPPTLDDGAERREED